MGGRSRAHVGWYGLGWRASLRPIRFRRSVYCDIHSLALASGSLVCACKFLLLAWRMLELRVVVDLWYFGPMSSSKVGIQLCWTPLLSWVLVLCTPLSASDALVFGLLFASPVWVTMGRIYMPFCSLQFGSPKVHVA